MRRLAAIPLALALTAFPALAQDDEDGGGFLTRLIEDNLSSAGREVRVQGFQGALSSQATLERLTIADDQGVWLTLEGAELDWNRGALLRGRLDVTALTAETLIVERLPEGEEGLEPPEPAARGFSLPDLPVAIEIDQLAIGRAVLGEPILGTRAELTLDGSVSLVGGEGRAELDVARIDGQEGSVTLDVAYANATRELNIALSLEEAEGGIAATLLNLPGAPPVSLSVDGAGPLSDFTADIRLATDGVERLEGSVTLAENDAGERRFAAALSGDLAPLFAPDYRPFFGDSITVEAAGQRSSEGITTLSALTLRTRSLTLDGSAVIAPDGLPERIDVSGRIANAEGGAVLLPLPGQPTRIEEATLAVDFDAAEGDRWIAQIAAEELDRPDLFAERLVLSGNGRISRADGQPAVTADIDFRGTGVRFGEPGVSEALGETLAGRAEFSWQQGEPLEIATLRLDAAGLALDATGQIDELDAGIVLSGEASARIAALAPFSTLAGRDLAGAISAEIAGEGSLLGGAFDVTLEATGQDLAFGVPRVDPLWRGESQLSLSARRDETGTVIERFRIASDQARASLTGRLAAGEGEVDLALAMPNVAVVAPGATGPATLEAQATLEGATWRVSADASAPGGTALAFRGTIADVEETGRFDGTLEASADDLSVWSGLAGQSLSGAFDATLSGSGAIDPLGFDVALEATGRNLSTGIAELDQLIGGRSQVSLAAEGTADSLTLRRARIETPQLTASASGSLEGATGQIDLNARLADLGLFVPDIRGPASVQGTVARIARGWRVDLDGTGPGGTTLRAAGTLGESFETANLNLSGRAPLALANTRIAPISLDGTLNFDLLLNGPPALQSLSGRISTADARLVNPSPAVILNDLDARATLSGGRAQITASAQVDGGGRVSVQGPVTLSPPFGASLNATLQGVVLSDPELYETVVDAQLSIEGPLTGGAAIAGRVTVGETEIGIPSTGMGATGPIPEIIHLNEPADVRRTRLRAGLIDTGDGSGAGAGPAFPLNILVQAPRRIFIRGRGLDAELGGQLRLTGTTANVIPSGSFELIRGRLDFLGERLVLTEGRATLQGAFVPYLDLAARAEAEEVTMIVSVEGPADSPEITFTSEPELPEDEVLARFLFGRSVTELSALQAVRLASAVATLAGRGGLDIVGRLRQGVGLADLDVRTNAEGQTEVTAGTYLGENLYTDVTVSDGETEINLNLDLSRSVTARGSVDSEGDTSIGIFFERDY